jgi:Flp pilus assembly protein TadD
MLQNAMKQILRVLTALCGAALCGCQPTASESFRQHYERAQSEYEAGQRSAAIAEYREALRSKPDSADAHTKLGAVLYEVGEADAAIQEYRRALRLDPDFAEAHNDLGVALLARGEIAAAAGESRQAVASRPQFAEAQYNLCLALELLEQIDDALTHCQIASQQDPGRPGVSAAVERLQYKRAAR